MASLLIKRIPPVYPEQARLNRIQGTLILKARISTEGEVTEVSVACGESIAGERPLSSDEKMEIQAQSLPGQPVEGGTTIPMNFVLR